MQVAVIGAGVVGALTAERLLDKGCQVTVFEAQQGPAQGASAANGAQLSYSFADPMATPGMLAKIPAALLGSDLGLRVRLRANADFLRWGIGFLRNCSTARAATNATTLLNLAAQSALLMRSYAAEFGADYATRQAGKLVLFDRKPQPADYRRLEVKTAAGCDARLISMDEAAVLEPALRHWRRLPDFAIYSPKDEVGDAERFTEVLLTRIERAGVRLQYGERITTINHLPERRLELVSAQSLGAYDAVVVCTGGAPTSLLAPLGMRLPIYPITGYSLTLPAVTSSAGVSITALEHKVVFSRLGDTVRVAGFADLNPTAAQCQERQRQLLQLAQQLAPDAADYAVADPRWWTGHRPMTPSGTPILGRSDVPGLYLNLGHGMLGWTLAAGSAQRIADAVAERCSRPSKQTVAAGVALQ